MFIDSYLSYIQKWSKMLSRLYFMVRTLRSNIWYRKAALFYLITKHLFQYYFFPFEIFKMDFWRKVSFSPELCKEVLLIQFSLSIAMFTNFASKIFQKEKKSYFLGHTLECNKIIRKQAVRNTDGMSCSDHLIYCVDHNLVTGTDVPTAHSITPISPHPLILSSGQMNNGHLSFLLQQIETKKM